MLDDPCRFALVLQVRVDAVDDAKKTLKFSSRSSTLELESFTVSLAEVLLAPPTHAPLPVPHTPGAIGNLYLSKQGWTATAASGATLYKAGDPSYVLFKWPRCIPFRTLDALRVTPSAIVLEGRNMATDKSITIDLLGPHAAPAQSIDWRAAAPLTIHLSDAGAQANGGEHVMSVWPKQLNVTCASLQKPHVSATIDVLDVFFADFNQRFAWSTPKTPIDLVLSVDGFDKLDVVPPSFIHLANGFPVSYPKEVAAECERMKSQDPANRAIFKRAREQALKS